MIEVSQLKCEATNYVSGIQSFEAFEDWLIEQARFAFTENPPETRRLVGEINLLIFDYLDGRLGEQVFKTNLSALLDVVN